MNVNEKIISIRYSLFGMSESAPISYQQSLSQARMALNRFISGGNLSALSDAISHITFIGYEHETPFNNKLLDLSDGLIEILRNLEKRK